MFLLGPKGYWYNFLPEGLFDNLINLKVLWVNTSLFRLSNKLKRLSPEEPRDQPEVIGRTQGLKVIVRSSSFSAVKFRYIFFLKQSFLVEP